MRGSVQNLIVKSTPVFNPRNIVLPAPGRCHFLARSAPKARGIEYSGVVYLLAVSRATESQHAQSKSRSADTIAFD